MGPLLTLVHTAALERRKMLNLAVQVLGPCFIVRQMTARHEFLTQVRQPDQPRRCVWRQFVHIVAVRVIHCDRHLAAGNMFDEWLKVRITRDEHHPRNATAVKIIRGLYRDIDVRFLPLQHIAINSLRARSRPRFLPHFGALN